ncbi:MAG: glycosyltransferase [Acetatifactor sp.]|nr:glycosyltransferase [Acetatifactor sp.]MDE7044926.1 glycosyltransferase [Acetatifactor sp.]
MIEEQLQLAGICLSDEELRLFISSCVHIERTVSSHYRERIVASVARAGIPLELYGDGWEKCDWIRLPNVHYGGRVTPEKILERMEDSKIVLNTLPWFRDGSHERVFNAMLCGAVAVSETSRYLEEVLAPDTWVSFDLSDESISALSGEINNLLADENRLQQIASAGQELALSSHTWRARARELHEDLLSYM